MEKPLSIILLIILSFVLIFAVMVILQMMKSGTNEPTIRLNQACLELIKKGCDDNLVVIDSKSFDEICNQNGMKLENCKKYCGC
ncbi:MAG: hypothetical protein QXU74_01855 [Candidatus Aenigmatarchaeota archaeon]